MAKIMIIDDEPDVIELVSFVLDKDGHQIFSADNGETGLLKIRDENPDLIILDVMMPGMDGYTVNAKLLEQETTREIPVIILTAKGKVRDLFQSNNIAGYIDKPFEPAVLKETIREILEKKKK